MVFKKYNGPFYFYQVKRKKYFLFLLKLRILMIFYLFKFFITLCVRILTGNENYQEGSFTAAIYRSHYKSTKEHSADAWAILLPYLAQQRCGCFVVSVSQRKTHWLLNEGVSAEPIECLIHFALPLSPLSLVCFSSCLISDFGGCFLGFVSEVFGLHLCIQVCASIFERSYSPFE